MDDSAVQDSGDNHTIQPSKYRAELSTALSDANPSEPESESQPSVGTAVAYSPHCSLPPVINAYAQHFKSLNLCGTNEHDHLYTVELHTGYRDTTPLGKRPGLLLHNGKSNKDPILAAAGDESRHATRAYAFNLKSIILIPPLEPTDDSEALITESMHARTSGDHHVVFDFTIEVGHGEKVQREQFEWRKIKKGVDKEVKDGGFRLVRSAQSTSGQATSSSSPADDVEVLALLLWRKMFTSFKHMFTLRFIGSGASGVWGERWSLMVVMTALRLWQLKIHGKTTKGVISMAEKIHHS